MELTQAVLSVAQLMPLQAFSGQFLQWAVVFFVLAIIAALVGARGVAGVTMNVARWFVIIFIVLALITLIL
ncbi:MULTISPECIES: DUF1328 domain-containing protein [unclassified Haladaptatus]|uniref:DUF1328 domain-containing protein n=1 Tax=unclassified Haladaptatus TaxID=2622732 RepID=UPI0023E8F9AE|nr:MULTISPECIES: DUF1328 domain-containing protein [unclassified Haladaptatus]